MNIRIMKQLPLLISLLLLTACSTQTSTVSGNQSGQSSQSTPGSQLFGQQNRTTLASTTEVKKTPTEPVPNNNMRRVVLKAPKRTVTSTVITRPTTNTNTRVITSTPIPVIPPRPIVVPPRPIVVQPRPVVVRPAPVRKPVVAVRPKPLPLPVKKPQSTLRRLTLNGSANFKSSSSRLTPAGKTKLLALTRSLKAGNTKISRLLIEGHTDSVGNAAMNQVLSLKRANAVADYLAKEGGFARSSIETVGLGESKPVASNKTSAGRALNRRVEISATGTRQITR